VKVPPWLNQSRNTALIAGSAPAVAGPRDRSTTRRGQIGSKLLPVWGGQCEFERVTRKTPTATLAAASRNVTEYAKSFTGAFSGGDLRGMQSVCMDLPKGVSGSLK